MARLERVTSAANPLLRDVRRAISRGTLTEQGCCVAESFHLLEEALRSDCEVRVVLASDAVQSTIESHVRRLNGVRVVVIADGLFQEIAGTEAPQGVIALVQPPVWNLDELFRGRSLAVALDGVQDAGNAGTIVRSAEAFGATGVMFLKGTVSPFNPKTLRAAAGSLFRVPFVFGLDAELAQAALRQKKLEVYAGVPGARKSLAQVDLTRKCALIVGSEGWGVSDAFRGSAQELAIPTTGVESLNAAMAATVLLYEAHRQRSQRA